MSCMANKASRSFDTFCSTSVASGCLSGVLVVERNGRSNKELGLQRCVPYGSTVLWADRLTRPTLVIRIIKISLAHVHANVRRWLKSVQY